MAKDPLTFAQELKALYADRLLSVVLYGSAVTKERVVGYSDYNILAIFNEVTVPDLRKMSKVAKAWSKQGNPTPLVFTLQQLKRSADVFPMELLDIKEAHQVLIGDDLLGQVHVDEKNLRHQLEYELKGKAIQLREAYIIASDNEKAVKELISKSVSLFQILMRQALRLLKQQPLPPKKDAPRILARYIEFDAAVFDVVERLREGQEVAVDVHELMQGYVGAIEKIAESVDGHASGKPG
ncbi:MAG: hypothetical protein AABZ44_05915 [Elusimicrobiota bacterium]